MFQTYKMEWAHNGLGEKENIKREKGENVNSPEKLLQLSRTCPKIKGMVS
jgi:hypothetical protein